MKISDKVTWQVHSFTSGTICISPNDPNYPDIHGRYSHDPAMLGINDALNQRMRLEMHRDICSFLCGHTGHPAWLKDWERAGDNLLRSPIGGTILIHGPSILSPNDNGKFNWYEDPSEDAAKLRKEICDILEYGQ